MENIKMKQPKIEVIDWKAIRSAAYETLDGAERKADFKLWLEKKKIELMPWQLSAAQKIVSRPSRSGKTFLLKLLRDYLESPLRNVRTKRKESK